MITFNSHLPVQPCQYCGTNHVLRFARVGERILAECPIAKKQIILNLQTGQLEFVEVLEPTHLEHLVPTGMIHA